jgi:hypothetical protein
MSKITRKLGIWKISTSLVVRFKFLSNVTIIQTINNNKLKKDEHIKIDSKKRVVSNGG